LEHAELDAVVDQLDEVTGARAAGMDVAALDRELPQNGLEPGHRVAIAAGHEAGAVERAARAAAGAEIDEVDAAPAQSCVAADRIAPIGIAAIGNDVAGIKDGAEF